MSTERVNVVFGADTGPLRSGVNQAKQALGGLKSSVGAVAGAFGVALGGAALVSAGKSAIQAAADFEALKLSLESVKDANESVDDLVKKSRELAKMPGLGLNEVVKAFIQLKAIGQSTQGAERIIREIGNATVRGGGGIQQFEDAIYAIQQIAGNGKLMGQDLNQLKNAIPSIGAALKEAFGSAAIDSISDADKEAGVFLQKLLDVLSESERVKGGMQNNIDNMSDAWRYAKAAIGDYLAILTSPAMKEATRMLQEQADTAAKMRQGGPGGVAGWAVAKARGTTEEKLEAQVSAAADENRRMRALSGNALEASIKAAENLGRVFGPGNRAGAAEFKANLPEFGPGNEAGREEFERLEAAKRYYAFLESKRAVEGGLAEALRLRAGMEPTQAVADSLAQIGGGGGVFGGGGNEQIQRMDEQIRFLQEQLTTLSSIERNTAKGKAMRP